MRHGRSGVGEWLLLAAGVALSTAVVPPARVFAQGDAAPTAPTAPTTEAAPAPAPPPKVLVQVTGSAPPDRKSSLAGALEAQFAALDIALQIDVAAPTPASAAERFEQGRELARQSGARAVFWIELEGETLWFVYMMDPADERILVRQVDASAPAAAVEAVAVIVKASTQALLAGNLESLEGEELVPPEPVVVAPPPPPPPPPPSPPPPPPAPPDHSGLRLALGYAGCTFAAEHTWQSGVALSASWITASGLYGGLGYAWFVHSVPDDPVGIAVQRHPVSLMVGKRLWKGRLAVDLEAGLMVDVLTRHTTETPQGVAANPDSTRVTAALTPRLRTELALFEPLAAYLDLGLAYVLNNFEYIAADPERVVLSPHRLRAELGVGLAVRL